MKYLVLTASLGALGMAAASPAMACMGPQFESTIYVTQKERPSAADVPEGYAVFKVRYGGERSGREDRLWPNYYVVEILEGPGAGGEALIPAHETSCDSTALAPVTGYVIGQLSHAERRDDDPRPVLGKRLTDRRVKNWPAEILTPAS